MLLAESKPPPERRQSFWKARATVDATLGSSCASAAKRADLIVLLGKALDFTIKWMAASSSIRRSGSLLSLIPTRNS